MRLNAYGRQQYGDACRKQVNKSTDLIIIRRDQEITELAISLCQSQRWDK